MGIFGLTQLWHRVLGWTCGERSFLQEFRKSPNSTWIAKPTGTTNRQKLWNWLRTQKSNSRQTLVALNKDAQRWNWHSRKQRLLLSAAEVKHRAVEFFWSQNCGIVSSVVFALACRSCGRLWCWGTNSKGGRILARRTALCAASCCACFRAAKLLRLLVQEKNQQGQPLPFREPYIISRTGPSDHPSSKDPRVASLLQVTSVIHYLWGARSSTWGGQAETIWKNRVLLLLILPRSTGTLSRICNADWSVSGCMSWSPTTSHWRWALKTAALLVTSHGPAMLVLTKKLWRLDDSCSILQQYLARVPQNKGTKKEPVGTFHVVRLRRILLRLYLGLPLWAGILSVEETTGELSIYQTKNGVWPTHTTVIEFHGWHTTTM